MTRNSRPTAPPALGKVGTCGLDTTDLSPEACHPAMLDDYLRTHEAGPEIQFPVGQPAVGGNILRQIKSSNVAMNFALNKNRVMFCNQQCFALFQSMFCNFCKSSGVLMCLVY